MNKLISIHLLLIILFTLTGCTFIRMGQEGAEKLKTSTTHGYQNGVEPDSIRNIKDYIVDENDFVIIAENSNKTLYKTRNESNLGRLSILTDLVDYCEDIGGKARFGKQFGFSIAKDFDSMDFEFSSIRSEYKKNRIRGYEGWMKCSGSTDDFEVRRKGRSHYFLISHDKEQLQGYSFRWYMDYFNLKDLDLKSLNIGVWSYSALIQFSGVCQLYNGKNTISNRFTNNKDMDIDNYLINQFDPLNPGKGYILASGNLSCTKSDEGKSDYVLDINFSKKYRKLLYTRRQ